ncbi:MAG: hypothetical protein IRY92_04195 [Dactylosporangium sp.]|nr:hypothetical protein [Dactylosporangium sp.]
MAALDEKQRLLAEAERQTEQARLLADLVVGAALAHARRGEAGLQAGSVAASTEIEKYLKGGEVEREDVLATRDRWLATDNPDAGTPRQPLHWPLVFPEVFERGGFDAIIGNPPFLHGTKVTASMGTSYRELLVIATANGRRGNADLVAYFALRAHELIGPGAAQVGLIATNSLAAGDSREVGLDQITAQGISIIRAVKSRPWPSRSATVEYCAVWTARESEAASAARVLDGRIVSGITSTLDAVGRATGKPHRLWANKGLVYNGSKIDGVGFTMDGARARELIEADGRNAEVLSLFLNGQDVNSSPEHRASRWVVNFRDWSMARAASYPACFDHVVRFVKPERELNNDRIRRERWWCFGRPTVELYNAISGQDRTIVITAVSKTVMPAMVSAKQTFSHALNVFASADMALFALLSSGPHYWWVASWASAMRTDIRYAPSDVFETFALPEMTEEMRRLGDRLDTYRRDLMLARQAGLTATYNLVNDPTCRDADIEELRNIHRQIDEAVCRAYGWDDLLVQGLDHDFYDLGREVRYTIGPSVRQEILDRLLELNHERYAAEVAAGLHDKKTGAGAKKTGTRGKKKTNAAQPALALDGDPDDAEESA